MFSCDSRGLETVPEDHRVVPAARGDEEIRRRTFFKGLRGVGADPVSSNDRPLVATELKQRDVQRDHGAMGILGRVAQRIRLALSRRVEGLLVLVVAVDGRLERIEQYVV